MAVLPTCLLGIYLLGRVQPFRRGNQCLCGTTKRSNSPIKWNINEDILHGECYALLRVVFDFKYKFPLSCPIYTHAVPLPIYLSFYWLIKVLYFYLVHDFLFVILFLLSVWLWYYSFYVIHLSINQLNVCTQFA